MNMVQTCIPAVIVNYSHARFEDFAVAEKVELNWRVDVGIEAKIASAMEQISRLRNVYQMRGITPPSSRPHRCGRQSQ